MAIGTVARVWRYPSVLPPATKPVSYRLSLQQLPSLFLLQSLASTFHAEETASQTHARRTSRARMAQGTQSRAQSRAAEAPWWQREGRRPRCGGEQRRWACTQAATLCKRRGQRWRVRPAAAPTSVDVTRMGRGGRGGGLRAVGGGALSGQD